MKMNPSSNQAVISSKEQADAEIDLKQVSGALLRNKFLIAKITAAALVLSGIYAFT